MEKTLQEKMYEARNVEGGLDEINDVVKLRLSMGLAEKFFLDRHWRRSYSVVVHTGMRSLIFGLMPVTKVMIEQGGRDQRWYLSHEGLSC